MTDRNHQSNRSDSAEVLSAWWDDQPVSEDGDTLQGLLSDSEQGRLRHKLRGYQAIRAHLQQQPPAPDLLASMSAALDRVDEERASLPKQDWALNSRDYQQPAANPPRKLVPEALRAPALAASVIVAMLAVGVAFFNEPQQTNPAATQQAAGPSENDLALQATLESVTQTPQMLSFNQTDSAGAQNQPAAQPAASSDLPAWARDTRSESVNDPYLATHYRMTTPEYGVVPVQMQTRFVRD